MPRGKVDGIGAGGNGGIDRGIEIDFYLIVGVQTVGTGACNGQEQAEKFLHFLVA